MGGDTRYCTNCRRDIASANYVIHNVHCERKIQLCESCDEPIPRTEMERHMEEFHTLDNCKFCGDELEKWQLESHIEKCPKRLVSCNFCQLKVPLDQLTEHCNVCGNRTEQCKCCKAYVKLKDLDEHKHECKRERQKKKFSLCEYCLETFPLESLPKHALICMARIETCFKCDEKYSFKDRNDHNCKVPSIPCEYCDSSLSFYEYESHLLCCSVQVTNCPKCATSFLRKDKDSHSCQSSNLQRSTQNVLTSYGNCGVCRSVIPWLDMREHEASCRLSLYPSEEEEETISDSANLRGKFVHSKSDSKPQKKMVQKTENKFGMNTCKFCKKRMPDLMMKEHMESCGEHPLTCPLCQEEVLRKEKQFHDELRCHIKLNTNRECLDNLEGASGYTKSYEKKLKLCAFCHEKFPKIMFQDHLAECKEQPFQCRLCLKMMPLRSWPNHESKECNYKKRTITGFENQEPKEKPVRQQPVDNNYEKNYQFCPHCNYKIPDAKLEEHIKSCSKGKKKCSFCKMEIDKDDEEIHFENCLTLCTENQGFQTAGSGNQKSKGAASQRPINKNYKKSSQNCPHCFSKFPEAEMEEHVKGCSKQKRMCNVCNTEILIVNEMVHLKKCFGVDVKDENQEFQTAGGKKNKKKKKQSTEPEQPKGRLRHAFSNFSTNLFGSFKAAESTPETNHYEITNLPCEFCEKLFPDHFLIEHESGCRPDLVSLPKTEELHGSDNYGSSPTNDRNQLSSRTDSQPALRNSGALPKKNRFHADFYGSLDEAFMSQQSPPKKDSDYFNYKSGIPDHLSSSEVEIEMKTSSKFQDKTPDNKVLGDVENEGKQPQNSSTRMFNFSSSSNGSSPHQVVEDMDYFNYKSGITEQLSSSKVEIESKTSSKFQDKPPDNKVLGDIENEGKQPQNSSTRMFNFSSSSSGSSPHQAKYKPLFLNKEGSMSAGDTASLSKAVGAERTERKKNVQGVFTNSANESTETLGANYMAKEIHNINIKRYLELLTSNVEIPSITEDDLKNAETFGTNFNPSEPFTMQNEANLSDSIEQFYDAEDNLKISNVQSCPDMEGMDVYFRFLMNSEEENTMPDNSKRHSGFPSIECKCGNMTCYCNVVNSMAALGKDNLQQTQGYLENSNVDGKSQSQETYLETTFPREANGGRP